MYVKIHIKNVDSFRMPWSLITLIPSFSLRIAQASQKELADLSQALENERYRAERLEAQVNDLTELHQVIKAVNAACVMRKILIHSSPVLRMKSRI